MQYYRSKYRNLSVAIDNPPSISTCGKHASKLLISTCAQWGRGVCVCVCGGGGPSYKLCYRKEDGVHADHS